MVVLLNPFKIFKPNGYALLICKALYTVKQYIFARHNGFANMGDARGKLIPLFFLLLSLGSPVLNLIGCYVYPKRVSGKIQNEKRRFFIHRGGFSSVATKLWNECQP